jgi:hypothetical protein
MITTYTDLTMEGESSIDQRLHLHVLRLHRERLDDFSENNIRWNGIDQTGEEGLAGTNKCRWGSEEPENFSQLT